MCPEQIVTYETGMDIWSHLPIPATKQGAHDSESEGSYRSRLRRGELGDSTTLIDIRLRLLVYTR
jgi:hypothetical protein